MTHANIVNPCEQFSRPWEAQPQSRARILGFGWPPYQPMRGCFGLALVLKLASELEIDGDHGRSATVIGFPAALA